jgi:hypothetical protein
MTDAVPFDPELALRALVEGGVEFVIIGGIGARLLGSPSITFDLDICYARDQTNLEALAAVLRDLHASLRGVDRAVPFRMDARTLAAGDSFTFDTDAGPLDILGTPAGTAGYDELAKTAVKQDLSLGEVLVADIDSLMRMKRAAGRLKDKVELEILGALRDELDRGAT